MSKRWSSEEKEQLRELFLEKQLPIAEISSLLGRTPASVNNGLTNFGIPRRRSLPKFRMPQRMTPVLARVHAHVCGDGYVYVRRERDDYGYLKEYRQGYFRYRYGFAYTNLNPKLIGSFMADVQEVFNLKPRYDPKRWTAYVKSKDAWELLTGLGAGKSRHWRVDREITKGSGSIKAAWLKAFFDDEAHFDPAGRIRVRSVNRPGLEQAALMLRQFVPCHITPLKGLYPDDSCYLVVPSSARDRFLRLIGSTKFNGAS